MMKFEESCSIAGQLCFVVRRNGAVIEEYREDNMIMTLGRVAVARLFAGLDGGVGMYIGVGTNNAEPDPEQTELTNQYLVQASKVGFVRPQADDGRSRKKY